MRGITVRFGAEETARFEAELARIHATGWRVSKADLIRAAVAHYLQHVAPPPASVQERDP